MFTLVFWVFCWQRLGILLCAATLPSFPFLSASWPISYLTPADITISNTFFIKTFFRNRIWSVLLASGDIHAKTGVWKKCPAVTGTKWSSHCPNSETSGIHSRLGLLVNCFSSRETAGWGKRRWCLLASLFAMLHTGCAPNTGASHSVGKTRGTMVSKFEGFWHDSARGCPVYRKNPQHHSYRPLKQHATLDPKQHSSNTTWGWRGHCWDTASKFPSLPAEQPVQPYWPSKAAQAQSGSCSTEKWLSSSSPSCLRVPPWPHGWQYSCQTSAKQWKALSQVGRDGVYTHFILSECSVSGIACVIKLMMHFQADPVFLKIQGKLYCQLLNDH